MIPTVSYPEDARQLPRQIPCSGTLDEEIRWLCWEARRSQGNILEIGTQFGLTTRCLALACPDKLVFSVDYIVERGTMVEDQKHEMPTLATVGSWARGLPNVFLSLQDSKTFDYDGKDIGFVFIDGDHSMSGVASDTELALSYYRRRNRPMTIVWHDFYDHPWVAVKRYLLTQNRFEIQHVENTHIAYLKLP